MSIHDKTFRHVDEKVLTPTDGTFLSGYDVSKHYAKPVRGYVVISDPDSGEVLETPNLVLLAGREFLAQKLADITGNTLVVPSALDLTKFKIRYFGVGSGGADTAEQPNKIGPFDNDIDLAIPRKFADIDTTNFSYLKAGYLKYIQADGGSIELVNETHEIVINGSSVEIEAATTVKYTMFIRKDELYKENTEQGPFAFNEAALYSVEYDTDSTPKSIDGTTMGKYNANVRTFARFTTMTKWLEVKDSLKIEWYILV